MKGPPMSDYGSPSYGASGIFASAGSGISSDNDFLKAFANARTNKSTMETPPEHLRPGDEQRHPDDSLDGNIDPSFFDGTGSIPGWASDMSFQPLSPPDSASLEPKWDYGFSSYPPPANLLTSMPSARARTQFGQVTPPDDEYDEVESVLDRHMRDQRDEPISGPSSPSTAAPRESPTTGQKRTRGKASTATAKEPSAKRSRKSGGGRNGDGKPAGKTEDVRRSKFLERNRVAASKCRQKKKEWTQNLETRAREMQKQKSTLRVVVDSLRQEVLFLKGEMLKHSSCDCVEIQKFMKSHAHNLAFESGGVGNVTGEGDDDLDMSIEPALKREGSVGSSLHLDEEPIGDSRSHAEDSDHDLSAADARSIADDEGALEALLTNSLNEDADDE